MNIAIVQAYDNNIKEYAEYSRLLNAIYAAQKNYKYICFESDLVPAYMSVYYNKIIAINDVFENDKSIEWVLYLDSDAVITNSAYNIEDIIARHQDKEIIIAKDNNKIMNNGVFLIKNTVNMKKFLSQVFSNKDFFHTKTPEQSAMFYYLSNEYKKYVGKEQACFFNAYLPGYKDLEKDNPCPSHWTSESFILHLLSLPNKDRVVIFRQLLQQNNIVCISKQEEVSKII